jgi:hypothetical protein
MLPFRVTQIEQHRALQQEAATLFLPEICRPEFSRATRSSSGRKHPKLNRQIPELDHAVTLRKQTAETCSNGQKIEKCLRTFSAFISFLPAQVFAVSNSRNMGRSTRENERISQSGFSTSTRLAQSDFREGFGVRNYISNRLWPKTEGTENKPLNPV